jgi:hypothetical protein
MKRSEGAAAWKRLMSLLSQMNPAVLQFGHATAPEANLGACWGAVKPRS